MSTASIVMMIITLGFYGGGAIWLINRAFSSKTNKD